MYTCIAKLNIAIKDVIIYIKLYVVFNEAGDKTIPTRAT